MQITSRKLIDARQTGKLMHKMVDSYYLDMLPYAGLSVPEMFDKLKKIPFNADPDYIEVLKRPFYTMNQIGPGGDCDDKSIAMASYAKILGIPWRFLGVGRKNPNYDKILLTHVFTQLYINREWIDADCTYSFNILGMVRQPYDRIEVL